MATKRLVHTKRLSPTHFHELDVYYDRGGTNYWDYSQKLKGIYFASTVFEQEEGSILKTLKIGIGSKTPGVSYILVVPLETYRPRALREVRARVEVHAETMHALCDVDGASALRELKAILTGASVATVTA